MMILKSVLLGVVLFFIFSIAYLWYWIRPRAGLAISVTMLKALTIRDPFYWLVFVGMIGAGCMIVRAWPVKA
jgi:hypothetical protein